MRMITVCGECKSEDIDYKGKDEQGTEKCFCHKCNKETISIDRYVESPQERQRRAVYATGNRWAIENWNATHN